MSAVSPPTASPVAESPDAAGTRPARLSTAGLGYLLVVYAGWSSTYLAIRIAVREGGGFPPFLLGSTRLLVAGLILLVLAAWARQHIHLTRRDWPWFVGSAVLLWVGGNGLVTWAEQWAHSSYAALIVGSTPIWVALLEAVLNRRAPSSLLLGALAVGFAGLVVLAAPTLSTGILADVGALAALVGAPIAWGAGSLIQSRRLFDLGLFASSGLQQLVGGVGLMMVAVLGQEPLPSPAPEAWWAWGYLIVFASILTFTAFTQALRLLPTSVVFTYAYVNPVGAVLLGSLVLQEPITGWTIGGAALVLLGVAGVFHARRVPAAAGPRP